MNPTRTTFALLLAVLLALPCAAALAKPDRKATAKGDAPAAPATDDAAKPAADKDDADADSDGDKPGKKAKDTLKRPAAAVDPDEPGTVEGTITDKKKAPLVGVTVALYGKRKGDKESSNIDETLVGADGTFSLEGPPGAYRVIVTDNDQKLGFKSIRIKPGGTTKVEMRLARKEMKSDGMKDRGKGNDDPEYDGVGGLDVTRVRPGAREMDRRAGERGRPGGNDGPAQKKVSGKGRGRGR